MDIIQLQRDTSPTLIAAVQAQFKALHAHMAGLGLSDTLIPDGEQRWFEAIEPMLGRLTFVLVAQEQGRTLGFVAGTLRTRPAHVGGGLTGMLGHIHVIDEARGKGVGEQLVAALHAAFIGRGADRFETDVLVANAAAQRFFQRLGFVPDHLVLRMPLSGAERN